MPGSFMVAGLFFVYLPPFTHLPRKNTVTLVDGREVRYTCIRFQGKRSDVLY
jgi:hypothetical protein